MSDAQPHERLITLSLHIFPPKSSFAAKIVIDDGDCSSLSPALSLNMSLIGYCRKITTTLPSKNWKSRSLHEYHTTLNALSNNNNHSRGQLKEIRLYIRKRMARHMKIEMELTQEPHALLNISTSCLVTNNALDSVPTKPSALSKASTNSSVLAPSHSPFVLVQKTRLTPAECIYDTHR